MNYHHALMECGNRTSRRFPRSTIGQAAPIRARYGPLCPGRSTAHMGCNGTLTCFPSVRTQNGAAEPTLVGCSAPDGSAKASGQLLASAHSRERRGTCTSYLCRAGGHGRREAEEKTRKDYMLLPPRRVFERPTAQPAGWRLAGSHGHGPRASSRTAQAPVFARLSSSATAHRSLARGK